MEKITAAGVAIELRSYQAMRNRIKLRADSGEDVGLDLRAAQRCVDHFQKLLDSMSEMA
jgi:urease accessory protein UreE